MKLFYTSTACLLPNGAFCDPTSGVCLRPTRCVCDQSRGERRRSCSGLEFLTFTLFKTVQRRTSYIARESANIWKRSWAQRYVHEICDIIHHTSTPPWPPQPLGGKGILSIDQLLKYYPLYSFWHETLNKQHEIHYKILRSKEAIVVRTIPGTGVPSFLGAPKILKTTVVPVLRN